VRNNFAEYVTGIRLKIQELAISHDQIIYNVPTEEPVDNSEE